MIVYFTFSAAAADSLAFFANSASRAIFFFFNSGVDMTFNVNVMVTFRVDERLSGTTNWQGREVKRVVTFLQSCRALFLHTMKIEPFAELLASPLKMERKKKNSIERRCRKTIVRTLEFSTFPLFFATSNQSRRRL